MKLHRYIPLLILLLTQNLFSQETKLSRQKDNELLKKYVPAEFSKHAEYGKYVLDISKRNIELIQYRKADERLFIDAEGNYYFQKSGGQFHYQVNNEWRSIQQVATIANNEFGIFETQLPLTTNLKTGLTKFAVDNSTNVIRFGEQTTVKQLSASGKEISSSKFVVSSNERIKNRITLKDVYPNLDREQNFSFDQIQTNYILKSKPLLDAQTTDFVIEERFELPSGWTISGKKVGINEYEGELQILNERNQQVSKISKAVIYDAYKGNLQGTDHGFISNYTVQKIEGSVYVISIKVSKEWLFKSDRVYPVVLDPTLSNNYALNYGFNGNPGFDAACVVPLNITLPTGNPQVVTNTNAIYTVIAKGLIASSGSTDYYAEGNEQRTRIGLGTTGTVWHATQTGTGGQTNNPYDVNYNYNSNIANRCYGPGHTLEYLFQGYQTYFPVTGTAATNVSGCITNYQELKTNTLVITVTFNEFLMNTTSVGYTNTITAPAAPTCTDWSNTWCAGSGSSTSLNLVQGVNYSMENTGATSCSAVPLQTAYMQVWGPNGSVCGLNPLGTPQTNSITVTAATTGAHVLNVSSGNCNATANTCGGYTAADGSGQSAVLRYRQNTTVTNTTATTSMCTNNTRPLTATLGGTHDNPTIQWSVVSGPGTISGTTLTATGPGTIIVRATVGFCNSDISIVVDQNPTINVATTDATCFGYADGTATANVTPAGTYTYQWQSNTSTTNTVTNYRAGTYTVTASTANGCTSTQSFTINEPPGMTVTTSATIATCGLSNATATATVTGGTGVYSYAWTPSGQTSSSISNIPSGVHTVVVTDANGCTATAYAAVNNNVSLNVTFNVTNVRCYGESNGAATAVITGGSAPFQTAWVPTFTNGNTLSNVESGEYVFTVLDADGCFTSDTITITQPTPLAVTFNTLDPVCPSNFGELTANVSGGIQPYTYLWNQGALTGQQVTNLPVGGYLFQGSDANGCMIEDSVFLIQNGSLNISVTPENATVDEGNSIVLNASMSPYVNGVTFNWTPGATLSCTNCPNPTASPIENTSYIVTITTPNGCTATDSSVIKWNIFCGETFIPNMFSPNDDGENDVFKVVGRCVKNGTLRVFNRWGELMFVTTDLTEGWDGTHRGKPCNTGVYTFIFDGTNSNGEVKTMSGSLTLVR